MFYEKKNVGKVKIAPQILLEISEMVFIISDFFWHNLGKLK